MRNLITNSVPKSEQSLGENSLPRESTPVQQVSLYRYSPWGRRRLRMGTKLTAISSYINNIYLYTLLLQKSNKSKSIRRRKQRQTQRSCRCRSCTSCTLLQGMGRNVSFLVYQGNSGRNGHLNSQERLGNTSAYSRTRAWVRELAYPHRTEFLPSIYGPAAHRILCNYLISKGFPAVCVSP